MYILQSTTLNCITYWEVIVFLLVKNRTRRLHTGLDRDREEQDEDAERVSMCDVTISI